MAALASVMKGKAETDLENRYLRTGTAPQCPWSGVPLGRRNTRSCSAWHAT